MISRNIWRGLVILAAMALPATAEAHVSLHPNTLPAGSFPTIDIRVPNEETGANMTKVAVLFPPGFIDVSTGYIPGWKVQKKTHKLATPVKTDTGTVSEEVSEVIWSGGKLPPETFLDFPISTAIPDSAAGKPLTFKTVQTYDNGKVVRWIGPPSTDQPAPTINVTPKGGVIEDVAGTEAGPGSAQVTTKAAQAATTSTPDKSSDKASKGLAIAALVAGILALIAAVIALVIALGRRSRSVT